jgi:hypothetical protein
MRRDVLGRVRWGNVALVATVLAALAVVVAWPRLAPAPPSLPPDTPRPLVDGARAAGEVGETPGGRRDGRGRAGAGGRRRRTGRRRAARTAADETSPEARPRRRAARPSPPTAPGGDRAAAARTASGRRSSRSRRLVPAPENTAGSRPAALPRTGRPHATSMRAPAVPGEIRDSPWPTAFRSPASARRRAALGADVGDLLVDPVARVARGDDLLEPAGAARATRRSWSARRRSRPRAPHVERVDRQRELAQLLVRSCSPTGSRRRRAVHERPSLATRFIPSNIALTIITS